MPKPPTVYDVAAHAGVSIATVSRVIRDPDAVKATTRERVLQSIDALGYVPSASARGLANRRTGVIGLFFPRHDDSGLGEPTVTEQSTVSTIHEQDEQPDNDNLYYDEVLRGAELEASRRGFALMVASATGGELEQLVMDMAGRVDGMAVLAGTVPGEMLERVARHIPVVVLGGDGADDRFDHVHANNGPGMRALAEHVLASGAQSFAYIAGPEGVADDEERFGAFSQVVGDRLVEFLRGDFTRSGGRKAAARVTSDPDAIVCANDQTALGVLDVIQHQSRKPLVTGFDGIAAGRHSTPTLTTVHQPMAELGRAAVYAIAQRIEHPDAPRRTLTLPVTVVVRESAP
ncbi:LacI family transcriptional regulator [Microbacteriaceae bacterium SG_E_30_P1]|uniref:LacI family transcriptional regulator n=1 Tax=Antiquaquibacter oligotrophicus TaxID=2880260 RepID=A0ABT6KMX1_9MICO|nr:LacI family DNA-binding transcriptional regulator [Antiquaquibacter oligotrophicus]MDH6181349.1 LacI family transcriptional regulator [Antiquaquibacter oligotrophicus]UDF12958.1 LacI family transcriptional regulator [Antiquaquibacter oligotrophicus]